jgi:hypothetical protein
MSANQSLDMRTRIDGREPDRSPTSFFDEELPTAFERGSERLARALATLPLRPLTVDVEGTGSWVLSIDGTAAAVRRGQGGAVVAVDAEQLSDLAADQVTPVGWLANGTLRLQSSKLADVLNWWLVIRAALDGTVPYCHGDVDVDGLDLHRAFHPDDSLEEMSRFLYRTGYLHIAGVYSEQEMAEVSTDMDTAAPRYSPGDGRSWWAKLSDGSDALVRMQSFDTESQSVAGLVSDGRLDRFCGLSGDGHHWGRRSNNRLEALFKPIGVTQGISDIPWHKDCSLGRHSYDCCSMTVGISVSGADADSGQLRVVSGSHLALVWPGPVLQPELDLPVVDLATQTGDITIHLSCTLHMAQPPVARERRVMYTTLSLPPIDVEAAAAGMRRRDAIREAAPTRVSQPPSPVSR